MNPIRGVPMFDFLSMPLLERRRQGRYSAPHDDPCTAGQLLFAISPFPFPTMRSPSPCSDAQ